MQALFESSQGAIGHELGRSVVGWWRPGPPGRSPFQDAPTTATDVSSRSWISDVMRGRGKSGGNLGAGTGNLGSSRQDRPGEEASHVHGLAVVNVDKHTVWRAYRAYGHRNCRLDSLCVVLQNEAASDKEIRIGDGLEDSIVCLCIPCMGMGIRPSSIPVCLAWLQWMLRMPPLRYRWILAPISATRIVFPSPVLSESIG